jgi:hypothetical protein
VTAAEFQSPDLYVCSLLVASGFPIRRALVNGGQVTFCFDAAAASKAADFDAGTLVDARIFAVAHRQMKIRVARELAAARQR